MRDRLPQELHRRLISSITRANRFSWQKRQALPVHTRHLNLRLVRRRFSVFRCCGHCCTSTSWILHFTRRFRVRKRLLLGRIDSHGGSRSATIHLMHHRNAIRRHGAGLVERRKHRHIPDALHRRTAPVSARTPGAAISTGTSGSPITPAFDVASATPERKHQSHHKLKSHHDFTLPPGRRLSMPCRLFDTHTCRSAITSPTLFAITLTSDLHFHHQVS